MIKRLMNRLPGYPYLIGKMDQRDTAQRSAKELARDALLEAGKKGVRTGRFAILNRRLPKGINPR
jgi:hypothetical protein